MKHYYRRGLSYSLFDFDFYIYKRIMRKYMHDYSTDTRILRKLKIKTCGKQALVLKTIILKPATARTQGYSDEVLIKF